MASQLIIRSTFKSVEGNHEAVNGNETIARINGSIGGKLRITNRAYTVTFSTGETVDFTRNKGFTVDQVTYSVCINGQQLGNVKRRTIKGSYEVNLYQVEVDNCRLFTIDEGWISRGTTRYTNLEGQEITVFKGRTGLFDWKVSCASDIPKLDIALILFMKAMCGLMIQ